MTTERPRLSVVGTGYLGVTHAVCMAELGYEVIGLDVDADKIALLRKGVVPFYEPDLPDLLEKHNGRSLRFTTDYAELAESADIHFVCVGTPQLPGQYGADLRHVESAFASLARHLTRQSLVVGKSTVPAGTAVRMAQLVRDLAPSPAAEVAWNPEFLREGFAVADTLRPDRLVFGVESEWAETQLRAAFAPVIDQGAPVVVTDFATAELVKVAANSFLATKISFINAMAEMCEATGPTSRSSPPPSDTTRGSAAASWPPASVSAAGACRRTSGRSSRGPASSASTRRCRSSARSTRSISGGEPAPSKSAWTWLTAATRAFG